MTPHTKDELHMESHESFVFIRYGPQTTEVLDASVHYFKLIDDLLKDAREIRSFFSAGRITMSKEGERNNLLRVLRHFTGRKREEKSWDHMSKERSRQIENLADDIILVLHLAKQREKLFKKLRAQLEAQIAMSNVEIERLGNELQQLSAAQKKAAQILMTKVADLRDFVAAAEKYLDSPGNAT